MQTTQHPPLCQVLPHPACTINPDAVRAVQQATGQLLVITGGKPQLHFATGTTDPFPPGSHLRRFLIIDEHDSLLGGDVA